MSTHVFFHGIHLCLSYKHAYNIKEKSILSPDMGSTIDIFIRNGTLQMLHNHFTVLGLFHRLQGYRVLYVLCPGTAYCCCFLFSVDNSDYMRNGDFVPTRLQAQQDAVNLVCHSKTRSNPENNVGLIVMSR